MNASYYDSLSTWRSQPYTRAPNIRVHYVARLDLISPISTNLAETVRETQARLRESEVKVSSG